MIITICGKAGSGKGTLGRELQKKLGYELISIGSIRRTVAEKMGISISEFNRLGEQPEKSKEFDGKYEEYQKALKPQDNIILESRMGFYCQPDSFKVFLTISDEEAGRRIFNDHRATDQFASLEEAIQVTKIRNEADAQRYEKLYDVNFSDTSQFNLVVDTTNLTIEQTTEQVIEAFKEYQKSRN